MKVFSNSISQWIFVLTTFVIISRVTNSGLLFVQKKTIQIVLAWTKIPLKIETFMFFIFSFFPQKKWNPLMQKDKIETKPGLAQKYEENGTKRMKKKCQWNHQENK